VQRDGVEGIERTRRQHRQIALVELDLEDGERLTAGGDHHHADSRDEHARELHEGRARAMGDERARQDEDRQRALQVPMLMAVV
jgi:hypothetical protein